MYEEWKRLYVEEHWTLRMIADMFGTNHHFVRRRLVEMGVEIRQGGRRGITMTEAQKKLISERNKGRPGFWSGKKMPKESLYKNMMHHLRWDVDLEFLLQFEDLERVKLLNDMLSSALSRKNSLEEFDVETYKRFIEKFYDDEQFLRQLALYRESGNKHDYPTLDHKIPISRGGTTSDIDNLQIISWFENHAKWDMTPDEYEAMKQKYWRTKPFYLGG